LSIFLRFLLWFWLVDISLCHKKPLADSIQLIVHLANRPGFGPLVDEALTVREILEGAPMT
jgi:hypothetical protein